MNCFVEYNANPKNKQVGDCVIRAISTALNQDWETTYIEICIMGASQFNMPSSNAVWGLYLKNKGYERTAIINACNCYTIADFCKDHPNGTYIVGTGTHAVCVKDGKFYDVWDSGNETPIYYFTKDEE